MLRGLIGQVPIASAVEGGACRLEAVFTDAGAPPAGALSTRAVVTVRSRRIEAERADDLRGPVLTYPGKANGKKALGSVAHGHWLKFANVALAEVAGLTVRVSTGARASSIEIRRDAPDGPLLGVVNVAAKNDWNTFFEAATRFTTRADVRAAVYLVVAGEKKSGGLMSIDWVQFDPPTD